jgi:flagellar motility protein MotE (MotC chaperone)
MNSLLKIVLSILFFYLLGPNSLYMKSENLAYAQEEEAKDPPPPEKEVKEAKDTDKEKETPEIKDGEKKPKKIKLPKQNVTINPETFRMMEMIEKKNKELKIREDALATKETQLKTLEENIKKDLAKIELALKESKEQFGMKENLIKKNVDELIKVYSTMKADQAATLIAAIDEDLALRIISGMKSKVAGEVLSKLDVKVAKAISEKLAGKTVEVKK